MFRTDHSARFLENLTHFQEGANPEADDEADAKKSRRSTAPALADPVASYVSTAKCSTVASDGPPLGTTYGDALVPSTFDADAERTSVRTLGLSTTASAHERSGGGTCLPNGGHRPQRVLHVATCTDTMGFFEAHRLYYSNPDGSLPFTEEGGVQVLVPPTRTVVGSDGSSAVENLRIMNSGSDEDSDRMDEIVVDDGMSARSAGGRTPPAASEDGSLGFTIRSTIISRVDEEAALDATVTTMMGQTVVRRRRAKTFAESIQELAGVTVPTKRELRELARTITGPKSGTPKVLTSRGPPPPQPPAQYPYQLPQSLYGPYFEPISRLTIQELASSLNAPSLALGVGSRQGKRAVTAPKSARADYTVNEVDASPLNRNGAHNTTETRTFAELCELSRGSSRNWGLEWRAALAFPVTSLTRLACRYKLLTTISEAFAAAASEVAQCIVSERNHVFSSRTYKPLDGFPHVFVVNGVVYVLAQTAARNALYGSREAAGKAATLELLAQRAVLGAPHLSESVRGPLCCVVSVMGFKVFVSAPMPIRSSADIVYGSLSAPASHFTTTNFAQYAAYGLAEYFGLEEHAVVTGADADLEGTSHSLGNTQARQPKRQTKIVLPGDAKIVYSPADGTNWVMDCSRLMAPAASSLALALNVKKDDPHGKTLARHPVENMCNAPLSVLFRPEFLRTCPYTPINADACLLSQFGNRGGREAVSYLIQTLMGTNLPAAMNELLALEHQTGGDWGLAQISPILHRHGVNVRYMGRIYTALESTVRYPEAKEGLRTKLAYEMSARTFKAVLASQMSSELRYRGEGDRAVDMVRGLLLCDPCGAQYLWEAEMKPTMLHKFGVYVCPVEPLLHETASVQEVVADRTSYRVYRALGYTGKRRIEQAEAPSQWKATGAGFAQLDVEHIDREERENNTSSLYTLLGGNAERYCTLLHRVEDITGADLVADMRTKRVVCHYKPITKTNAPLAVSASVAAVVSAEGAFDLQAVLANLAADGKELREAVEATSRAEITAYERALESDPRVTLPIYMMVLCMRGQTSAQPLLTAIATKYVDVRKVVPSPIVHLLDNMQLAHMFSLIGRQDRCETALADAVTGLVAFGAETRSDPQCGQVHPVCFVGVLFTAAVAVANAWSSEFKSPPADKSERVLEYLHYAAYLAEECHHALLPYILYQIATYRRAFARLPMSTTGVENDRLSNTAVSTRTTRLGATRRRTIVGKKAQAGEGDVDPEAAYERKPLPPIRSVLLPADSSSVEVPCATLLEDILSPSEFMQRVGGRGAMDTDGLEEDLTKLYSRTATLCDQLPGVRPAGSDVLGASTVNLGMLTKDANLVRRGISDHEKTFGVDAKPTIRAEIELADVLLARAEYHCRYTGANRDPSYLYEAEAELRATLNKVLAHKECTGAYLPELQSLIASLHLVCDLYSKMPQARREHEARHFLPEVLPSVLGESHPLLRGVYDSTKTYYVSMAGLRKELAATLNALRTASEYALAWTECSVGCADAEEDIASHLTLFTEEIAKPLRNGGAAERNVSWHFFMQLSAMVQDSIFAKSAKIAAALAAMEGVHKSQLKVVELSERKAMLIQEITQCVKDMHLAVRRVKRHKNRLDHYAAIQTKEVMDLGAKVKALVKGVRDETVLARAQSAMEYHDEVLQVHNQQVLRQRQEADAAIQATMNLPPERREEMLRHEEDDGDEEAERLDGLAAASFAKGYRSPYACLLPPDEQSSDIRSATYIHLRDFAGPPTTLVALSGKHAPDANSPMQRGGGSGNRRNSSTTLVPGAMAAAMLNARMRLHETTASQAATLLPQVARSMAARNHNPIRSTSKR